MSCTSSLSLLFWNFLKALLMPNCPEDWLNVKKLQKHICKKKLKKKKTFFHKYPAQSLQLIKPPNLSCKYDGIKLMLETYKKKALGQNTLGIFCRAFNDFTAWLYLFLAAWILRYEKNISMIRERRKLLFSIIMSPFF